MWAFPKTGSSTGTPVIGPATYSAVVTMVMITTLVTPPLLKWSLSSRISGSPPAD